MKPNTAVIYESAALKQSCIHFWTIENVHGPVSRGTCKHCGAEKEFKNYPTDCAIHHNTFRELLVEPGQDEPGLYSFIEAEYEDMTATGQEDEEYEEAPDALCPAA